MKTRLLKTTLTLMLALIALPMMGQDFLNVFFKDGTERIFHLSNVEELAVTCIDADGVLHSNYDYQHIITPHGDYVYAIKDIDSIRFTKYEEYQVLENLQKVVDVVIPSITDCETVYEAVERLDQIKRMDGVEDAWIDGNVLSVRVIGWKTIHHLFTPHKSFPNDESSLVRPRLDKWKSAGRARIKDANGLTLRAVVANQQHSDDSPDRVNQREEYMYKLCDDLNDAGFEAEYRDNADMDFFYNDMYDYDIVLLSTHGVYSKGQHILLTSYKLGEKQANGSTDKNFSQQLESKFNELFTDSRFMFSEGDIDMYNCDEYYIVDNQYVKYTVYYAGIKESFFTNTVPLWRQFAHSNSIFFNAACESLLSGNSLANTLINNHGLGTYVGYTESNYYGQEAGCTMFWDMLNGISVEKAFSNLANHPISINDDTQHVTGTYKDEDIEEFHRDWLGFRHSDKHYIASVNLVPEKPDVCKQFITPVFTSNLSQEEVNRDFMDNGTVVVNAITTTMDASELTMGFLYGSDSHHLTNKVMAETIFDLYYPDKGNTCMAAKLTDLEPGNSYYYCAYTYDGLHYNYGDTCSFTTPNKPADIPAEAKDLGLPSGTKWASYNIGATAQEEYGEYFAWGELKEKDVFNESNYQFCKNGIYANIGDDIGGTEYDVAHERWGGKWMIPNKMMMQELYEYCTTKWTTQNDVYGTLFTGSNGETIFLPAAGYRKDNLQQQAGVWGDYWASTASEANTYSAYELYFKDGLIKCDYVYNDNPTYRTNGHTVRPVIPGLQLTSNGTLSILMGDSETVGVRYGSGSYRYEVDKEGIVSVEITGSTITIHALSGGDAVVTVIDNNGGKATISVAVKAIPEAKDLGLPSGTKWASFNIGANRPEEYGEYYAWGESGVKDAYTESTYEYCKNGMYTNIGKDIRGTEFDTAREKWGDEWKMPSKTQYNELYRYSTCEWTTFNGVYGYKFTSNINGEYVFFPAAGYYGNQVGNTGSYGFYWTGNRDAENADRATNLTIMDGSLVFSNNYRFYGFTIRPVISGLELSITETLGIFEGNSRIVTIKSGSGCYHYDVDKEGIVSVNFKGSTITINALKIGDVVLTVTDTKGGQKANITINVRAVPKAVDLGLPSGTKWANINVGANNPEEFGDYYSWGETEIKNTYTESTYKHYKNDSYVQIGYDIRGSEYDAAHTKWDDKWMMPSSTQFKELLDNCNSEWTTVNGIYGQKFISKINGNSIFLPAVGYYENGVSSSGRSGYYWACDRVSNNNNCGYCLCIKNNTTSLDYYTRYYGFAVRPVIREKNEEDDARMDEVVPEILRDEFRDHMPIYSGMNPPNIEGTYFISPYTVVYCEDGQWEPGHVISDYKIKFYNQSSSDNTIDMIEYNVKDNGDYSIGTGAFISGDGTHFTAYFSAEGFSKNIRTKESIVISGTKTDNGIENLVYGFVMVDKGSDPNNELMDVGVYRIFKDGDGISEPTTSEFESSARQSNPRDKSIAESMSERRGSFIHSDQRRPIKE